jgi:pSer/pThr/pTyr-binding forkhead associated (FHA) protein
MRPTVVITVQEGDRIKQQLRFGPGRASCTIGRAQGCQVRIPSDHVHLGISRRHCVLDIDAPAGWVRDLGSLNGTFLNGCCIGKREPSDAAQHPDRHRLSPGDVIRLGSTLLRFDIVGDDQGSARTEVSA